MKNFSKFIGNMAKIVTKIVEVFQWVGAVMQFTGSDTIREVILFPTMKPLDN